MPGRDTQMSGEQPVLVHIGYPKTGSTTLQGLFEENKDVAYLGKGPLEREAPGGLTNKVLKMLLCADDNSFAADIESLQQEIRQWSAGKPIVLSDEGLSFGKYMNRKLIWGDEAARIVNDAERLAPRIKALFPAARVLIYTREQSAFTVSYYKQHAKIGVVADSLADWCDSLENHFFELLDYAGTLQKYYEVFGSDSVCAIKFENIRSLEERDKLCRFVQQCLGIDTGFIREGYDEKHDNSDLGRMPEGIAKIRRVGPVAWVIKMIPGDAKQRLKRLFFKPHKLGDVESETQKIKGRFKASNAALKDVCGIEYR